MCVCVRALANYEALMMPQARQAEQSASSPANGTTEYFFMRIYVRALVCGTSLPGRHAFLSFLRQHVRVPFSLH